MGFVYGGEAPQMTKYLVICARVWGEACLMLPLARFQALIPGS